MGDPVERFWSKVDRRGPDECWLWTAGTFPFGYGAFQLHRGKTVGAHRHAWELVHGPAPRGAVIRHRCDVPACCNPAHLELGTQGDNNRDTVARGRHRTWHKLALGQREEIVALYRAGGCTQTSLARRFGISSVRVSVIVREEQQ